MMEMLGLWDFHWGNLHTDEVALRDGLYVLQKAELPKPVGIHVLPLQSLDSGHGVIDKV